MIWNICYLWSDICFLISLKDFFRETAKYKNLLEKNAALLKAVTKVAERQVLLDEIESQLSEFMQRFQVGNKAA